MSLKKDVEYNNFLSIKEAELFNNRIKKIEDDIKELKNRDKHPDLKYYKIYDDAQDIEFATKGSACFDVSAYLKDGEEVKYYDAFNNKKIKIVRDEKIKIYPKERILYPTGIILDIPIGYSVRTHPRSSTGVKLGLSHSHNEGIIDPDYYHELFMPYINNTDTVIIIEHNQKITQAEMIKTLNHGIKETKEEPKQKTDRVGGLGSTDNN